MDEPRVLHWERLTKKQFDALDRARAVVLVTCSPLEVHGPHLPLGADVLEGEGLAQRMLRFLPERHRGRTFLKLPCVYAASDPVPQPGSLAFRPSTTIAFLEDLGRTLAAQGFRFVLVSNFHGSPRHFLALEVACDRVSRERGIAMLCVFSAMLSRLRLAGSELGDVLGHHAGVAKSDFDGDTHGGLVETAQLLALHPELVDPDYKSLPTRSAELWLEERGEKRARGGAGGKLAAFGAMLEEFRDSLRFFAEETYSGSPARASAALGEGFLDSLGAAAGELVGQLLDGGLPEAEWHSPLWKLRHLFTHPAAVRIFDAWLGAPKTIR